MQQVRASARDRSARDRLRGGAPAQERELRSQGRETMQRLLDAGRAVFEQRGFHAARVDDIVSAAQASHGTFYLYFSNKEELFKALASDTLHDMAALVDTLGPVTPDGKGRAELRRWIGRFCDLYATHSTVLRAWTEGQMTDPRLIAEGGRMMRELATTLSERIGEHSTPGLEPKAAGIACLAMLERFNYFQQIRRSSPDRAAIVDTLTTSAYAGFFGGVA